LAGWQWLFIIEGAASFALGLIAISLLPDFPHSKTGAGMWLFSEEERQLATERIERDRVSDKESDHSIIYGLKLAAKDYRVWVFVSWPTITRVQYNAQKLTFLYQSIMLLC
jgi:hypothetical protein